MIDIAFDGADSVRARLAAIPVKAGSALRRASESVADQIRATAQGNVSGGVLQSRSGKLRDSLTVAISASGSRIAVAVDASEPYAAFQEYGYSGTESVREFLRRQSMVYGHATAPKEVTVRAHDRRVDYPGRSYLRAALADFAPAIRDAVSRATAEVLGS